MRISFGATYSFIFLYQDGRIIGEVKGSKGIILDIPVPASKAPIAKSAEIDNPHYPYIVATTHQPRRRGSQSQLCQIASALSASNIRHQLMIQLLRVFVCGRENKCWQFHVRRYTLHLRVVDRRGFLNAMFFNLAPVFCVQSFVLPSSISWESHPETDR